jgi:transcriptional regulator with XRE-family HTH domain
MRRQPSFIDKHVGARLRAARLEAGKSQTQVAEALGVTFQQLQKYEKGTNRMSAGTLHELSRLLDTPVQFFFDGLACISQTKRRIQAANQRKLLCHNDFRAIRREPRCRQSVAQNALILELSKIALWKPRLMAAW